MFSKRHYEYLASALAQSKSHHVDHIAAQRAWYETVRTIADRLSMDNPRFDRKRFLKASDASAADWLLVDTSIAAE